jgi:hypothetical protein
MEYFLETEDGTSGRPAAIRQAAPPPRQANRKERCRLCGYEKAEKAKAAL